jgi:Endonuclease-reverse transcriptase
MASTAVLSNRLTVLFWNCHSLNNKIFQLTHYCNTHSPHVVALAETWLSPFDTPHLNDYTLLPHSHTSHSGGLAFFIHDSVLSFSERTDLNITSGNCGAVWLQLHIPPLPTPVLIACVYRAPNSPATTWHRLLKSISDGTSKGLPTLVVGDFNAHHPSWDGQTKADSHGFSLFKCAQENNLCILNCVFDTGPTFPQSLSTLDLALCNSPALVEDFQVPNTTDLISDHLPILISLRPLVPGVCSNVTPHSKWNAKKADWTRFESVLDGITTRLLEGWRASPCLNLESLDHMWERLLDAIQYAAKQAVPRKQIKQGCKPWFNPSLLAKLRVFRRAKNRYFNNKSTGNYEAYIIARNAWDQHRRIARDDNIDRIASKLTNERNSKLNWSIWKQVTAPSASPLSAHSANGPPRTKKEALDNLGAFFAQTMTDRKDTDFSHTIGEFTDNVLFKNIKPHPLDTPFTLKEVATQCARAKEGTALGPDDVHPLFLRHAGPTFLSALLELFNRSWNLGLVPSAWKHSKAVAVWGQRRSL